MLSTPRGAVLLRRRRRERRRVGFDVEVRVGGGHAAELAVASGGLCAAAAAAARVPSVARHARELLRVYLIHARLH